jgi:hypothetical protein
MKLRHCLQAMTLSAFLVLSSAGFIDALGFATCYGADPCHACKNCKYCGFCAKRGGTCGVCKRR